MSKTSLLAYTSSDQCLDPVYESGWILTQSSASVQSNYDTVDPLAYGCRVGGWQLYPSFRELTLISATQKYFSGYVALCVSK